jgi:class 3 adenylate cyclase
LAESASIGVAAAQSLPDWERATRALLDEGQNFLAHDTAREGLKAHPGSHKLAVFGAVALSQTGAVEEARRLLKPVLDVLLIDEGPFQRLEACFQRAMMVAGSCDPDSLAAMIELAGAIDQARGRKSVETADTETYTALARVFFGAWQSTKAAHDLDLCAELYLRAFESRGNPLDGLDAAVMALLRGEEPQARALAERVLTRLDGEQLGADRAAYRRYRDLATRGLALLLRGDGDDAVAAFQDAAAIDGAGYPSEVAALKKLNLLRQGGIDVPAEIDTLVHPPAVVVFTGHALDRPGEGPHFPAELEVAMRGEIARTLDEIDARIGYSMGACGSDLLFIEAMLERGAEVNVVLPFALDDYIAHNVRYAGPRWEMRFRNALKLASTVTYATEERYLGHDMLYRFANQCLHGLATLRSDFLCARPTLLAVWDMMPESLVGGAADFIDHWEDISRLRIIDLDGLRQEILPDVEGEYGAFAMGGQAGEAEAEQGRVIRAMMFCDIAGYSKLKEEHVPVFLDFLALLRTSLDEGAPQPMAVNTWGDAIFAVMERASDMAEYATALQQAVLRADEELGDRLPHPLNLRISLHAGPVFEATDPICGRRNFYGSHINRAARLEPVTVIGHVYATQQFVAVLTAEQSALRSEAVSRDERFDDRYACEYVGVLSLAKDFGRQTVYHLRRAPPVVRPVEDLAPVDEDVGVEEPVPDDGVPTVSVEGSLRALEDRIREMASGSDDEDDEALLSQIDGGNAKGSWASVLDEDDDEGSVAEDIPAAAFGTGGDSFELDDDDLLEQFAEKTAETLSAPGVADAADFEMPTESGGDSFELDDDDLLEQFAEKTAETLNAPGVADAADFEMPAESGGDSFELDDDDLLEQFAEKTAETLSAPGVADAADFEMPTESGGDSFELDDDDLLEQFAEKTAETLNAAVADDDDEALLEEFAALSDGSRAGETEVADLDDDDILELFAEQSAEALTAPEFDEADAAVRDILECFAKKSAEVLNAASLDDDALLADFAERLEVDLPPVVEGDGECYNPDLANPEVSDILEEFAAKSEQALGIPADPNAGGFDVDHADPEVRGILEEFARKSEPVEAVPEIDGLELEAGDEADPQMREMMKELRRRMAVADKRSTAPAKPAPVAAKPPPPPKPATTDVAPEALAAFFGDEMLYPGA